MIKADQYALWRQGRFSDTSILVGDVSDEAAAFGAHKTDSAAFETDVRTGTRGRACNPCTASTRPSFTTSTGRALPTPMARLTSRVAARAKRLTC